MKGPYSFMIYYGGEMTIGHLAACDGDDDDVANTTERRTTRMNLRTEI